MTKPLTLPLALKRGLAAGVFALAPAGAAVSETPADGAAAVAACRAEPNAADRIACLEAALIALAGGSPESRSRAPAPVEPPHASAAPVSSASPAAAPDPGSTAAMEAPTGLGAEQVAARERDRGQSAGARETLSARIADFAYTADDALIVVLDNGQAWRQGGGDVSSIRLRETGAYTVEITEGFISGYRMRINEIRRTITVERIR